jgi:type I restriction-modification system DNA methylase subunit
MAIERYTESLTLDEMKCKLGDNSWGSVLPQGDVERFGEIEKLLKKAGGKPKKCPLEDYSSGGKGKAKPEYIITFNDNANTIIVVECKKSTKHHETSNRDCPNDYAVDGVLYYAKFLKEEYNVIAVAVSGTEKSKLKVDTFYWLKGIDFPLSLHNLGSEILTPQKYLEVIKGENIKKESSLDEIRNTAIVMNNSLREAGINEAQRPVFIAGILIALTNKSFINNYKNLSDFDTVMVNMKHAIDNVLNEHSIQKERIKFITSVIEQVKISPKFSAVRLDEDYSIMWYIRKIEREIKPLMSYTDNTLDVLGVFYSEFIKYTNSDGKGLGLVLTPQHITEFMCDLAGVNKNSKVIDICCGTGSFLVAAMSKMFKKATTNEMKKIRSDGLYGIEADLNFYILTIANMIIRQDGKSNIYNTDCLRDNNVFNKLKEKNINIGLLNPPYSQNDEELEFAERLLDIITIGGTGVVIVPVSCAIGRKFKSVRERLFKKHTLKAVFSMPDDVFYPTATNVCVMVWTAHTPHEDSKCETFFGYYKDDGFIKKKKLGRIDYFNKWTQILEKWLKLYKRNDVADGLSARAHIKHNDEWLCEAYMNNDFSFNRLTQEDFQKTIRDFLAYQISAGITDLSSNHKIEKITPTPPEKWKTFIVGGKDGLFSCETTRAVIASETEVGEIPHVTRSALNNGISDYISALEYDLNKGNCITIGAEGIIAFYQTKDFVTGVKVYTLRNENINKYNALFICTILNSYKYKYSYGRARILSKIKDEIIRLPATAQSTPDWRYMEKYIKSLPYSDKI